MRARWGSMRPGTPHVAGLADRSPEGTGVRWVPSAAVIAATLISPGPPASRPLGRRSLHLKNGPQIRRRLGGPRTRALSATPAPLPLFGEPGWQCSLSEPPNVRS